MADVSHVPPPVPEEGRIEVPARLASKLTIEQLDQLQLHARQHHDSRKFVVHVEHLLEKGIPFDEATKQAKQELKSSHGSHA